MTNNDKTTKKKSTIKETEAEQDVQNKNSTEVEKPVVEQPQDQVTPEQQNVDADAEKIAQLLVEDFIKELYSVFTQEQIDSISVEDQQLATDMLITGKMSSKQIVEQLHEKYTKPVQQLPPVIQTSTTQQQTKPEIKLKYEENPEDKGKQVAGFQMINDKQDNIILWKIAAIIFGFTTFGSIAALSILKFSAGGSWTILAMVFCAMTMCLVGFIMYLGKKTHAILEFKAMFSRKPLCIFFTDTKRVDWAVMEDEGGIVTHKSYGTFIVNPKSAYIDSKTRNVFLAFNPSIATNAEIETFKLTDAMSKVIKDERELGRIRYAIANATYDDSTEELVINSTNGTSEKLKPFKALRENIDFSHLKSFTNSILPHNINNKVHLEVERNVLNKGKVNIMQIILIFCAIFGAIVLGVLIIKYVLGTGGGGGSSTVVNNYVNGTAQMLANKVVPTATVVAQ
jgi:hypothetical protein